jgi:hypothetical protein
VREKLQIANWKLRIEYWRRNVLLAGFAPSLLCLFAGCPQAAKVTVTVVEAGGAQEKTAGETAPAAAEAKGYGSLVGTVRYEGSPPSFPPLVAEGGAGLKPEDKAVCAAHPVPDETLVVNPDNGGLANAIIFLEKRPGNIKPELARPPADPIKFDQKGCRFIPHVLVVQVGQPLLIISDDPITHNTHTFPSRNKLFNQAIAPNNRDGVPCDYSKAESGPIAVACDLHNWMKAYHFPIDHPYAAVTGKDGSFRIDGLPAGTHSFNVWHERGPGSSQLLDRKLQITIEVDKETTKDLNYAAAKFAAVSRIPRRAIACERLLDGGEIVVTQTEGQK